MPLRTLLRRGRSDHECREELQTHLEMATDEFIAQGLTPEEARRAALKRAGNLQARREEIYQMNGIAWLDSLLGDLRYTLRGLRNHPAFTAAALLTLALGIGANTAIFGVIDSILIRPLSYPHAENLVDVLHTAPGLPGIGDSVVCSPSMYFTYREENHTFQQFGLWSSGGASITGGAEPELPRALSVTYGVLDALGVKPLLGRWFSEADDTPGTPETVILTWGYWQRRFGGDKSIVGRTLTIDAKPTTVIGVMPREFRFLRDPELILPQRFERNKVWLGEFGYEGIARLKPGVTIAQANADLGRMLKVWLNAWPAPPGFERAVFINARFAPKMQSMKEGIVGDVGASLWIVMGTLGLLLLIACANVANLLLVRAESRRQELAIRASLGAGRGRIAREMLVESVTLGLIGGTLGLGLAYVALRILVVRGPDTLPRLAEIGIDPLALAFALGVSLFAGALFGLIPVFKYAGSRLATTLREVGRSYSEGRERHRARNTLVVVQVALALVLLIGSGLMIRTFQQLRSIRPGFTHPEEIQLIHLTIPETLAKEPVRAMRMYNDILDKLAALPGVTSVGFASSAPMESYMTPDNPLYAEDKTLQPGQTPATRKYRLIAPGFFGTMGTGLIAGRDFNWADLYAERHVAIISENVAREWWGEPRAALGKRVREGFNSPWREVVGVIEDVYENGLQVKPPGFAYLPALMDRYLVFNHEFVTGNGMFAIRSRRAGTESLLAEARRAIYSVNGRRPVFLVTTLKEHYDQSMARTSFTLVILAIAGGMSLVLGIIGIYGVIAYAVSQRTREIGIRMALGAQPAGLSGIFVRHSLLLAAIGAAIGLGAAAGLTRLMKSLLFGITPLDPVTYAAVSALLIAAAALASYVPARRVIAVDPVEALRRE